MTPPKSREQSADSAVLARDVAGLDRRVSALEADMEKREDSSEGLRREFADHRVDDAKAIGEVKTLIGAVEQKVADADAKLQSMRWMLASILALGGVGVAFLGFILSKVWR